MNAIEFYGRRVREVAGEDVRRNKAKDQEGAAMEAIDEVISGHLIDLILIIEKDEAQATLKMERKEVLERIDLVWKREYFKK